MKNTVFVSLFSLFLVSACSSGNSASHLPSPLELPGAVIGSVFENATYGVRKRRVEAYVAKNYLAIRADARKGGGQAIEGALNVAGLKGVKRDRARNELINDQAMYFHHVVSVVDNLINNFTALYMPNRREDKLINGFSYMEARGVIRDYADQNFEALRIAIQQGQGKALDELTSRLNIQNEQKRQAFKQRAKPLYKRIYLDLISVLLMVNS